MQTGGGPPSSRTILIVEDQALIAMYEANVLGNNGYQTRVAYNARDAVTAGLDPEIDLILMDIDLGCDRCGGTEAAAEILARREVPIVFLTSHSEKEMVDRVKGITRYGYVLKNAGEFVLLESVAMAFELFQANRALQLNEALYRNLMENSIDAIYLLSEEGAVLNVNAVACEMTGYTREELLSLTIDDIDPNYPSRGFIEFWKDRPEGATLLFETLHRRKDGTVFPVEVNGIFFVLDGVKRLYGVARDISERRLQEERDSLWSDLFEHARDPHALVSVADENEYRIIDVNRAYLDALQQHGLAVERETLRALPFADAARALGFDDALNEELTRRFTAVRETREIHRFDSSIPSPGGPVPVEETLIPILEEDGTCVTILYNARPVEPPV